MGNLANPVAKTHTDINGGYLDGYSWKNPSEDSDYYGNWNIYNKGVLIAVFKGNWRPVDFPSLEDIVEYRLNFTYKVNNQHTGQKGVNLRSSPGSGSEVVGFVLNGTHLVPTGNVEEGYMEVRILGKDGIEKETFWITTKEGYLTESHNYDEKNTKMDKDK